MINDNDVKLTDAARADMALTPAMRLRQAIDALVLRAR